MRGSVAVSLVAGCSLAAQSFVVIDDYTEGVISHTFTSPNSATDIQENLDTAHCAFGERQTFFQVISDFEQVPITYDQGGGIARVHTTPGGHNGMYTRLSYELGLTTPNVIDLSRETEFWVDEVAMHPDGRFADNWTIYINDENGGRSTNGGWLSRTGGIRFRFNGFIGDADFSRVSGIRMDVEFNSDTGPHPESYQITKFYAVPEPATFIAVGSGVFFVFRRQRRPA